MIKNYDEAMTVAELSRMLIGCDPDAKICIIRDIIAIPISKQEIDVSPIYPEKKYKCFSFRIDS